MIAIIQSDHQTVAAYYRMFSTDSSWTGPIIIQPSSIIMGTFTSFEGFVQTLLTQIHNGESEFLLACHGHPDGLPLPLVPGSLATANADLLDKLTLATGSDADARQDLLDTRSDVGNVPIFRNPRELDNLIALLRQVQGAIKRLEFRACNLGAGTALKAIHRVLGSRYTVAPTVLHVWASHPTARDHSRNAAEFQRHLDTLGFPRRVFSRDDCLLPFDSGAPGTNPALGMSVTVHADRPGQLSFHALNTDAILGWTQNFLEGSFFYPVGQHPPGGGYRRGGVLPLVGLWDNDNARVLFPGDNFDYLQKLAVEIS